MRSTALTVAALSACVVLGACAAPSQDARPTVRIAEAVQPSPVRALGTDLPTQEERPFWPERHDGPTRTGRPGHAAGERRRSGCVTCRLRQPGLPAAAGGLRGWSGAIRGESVVGRRILRWATGVGLLRRRAVFLGRLRPRRSSPRRPTSGTAATGRRWC